MTLLKKDHYLLANTEAEALSENSPDLRMDLMLNPNPYYNNGAVRGVVYDPLGTPLPNVILKLVDSENTIINHAITDAKGFYTFHHVLPQKEFTVLSWVPDYRLGESDPFILLPLQEIEVNINLAYDNSAHLAIVGGTVRNNAGEPISNAQIRYYLPDGNEETLISIAQSNDKGEYIISDLALGSYHIIIHADGYHPYDNYVNIAAQQSLHEAELTTDPSFQFGAIIGIISDDDGQPIQGAEVFLKRIEEDGTLTGVSHTKTAMKGTYLFTGLPKGNYRIETIKTTII